MLKVLAGIIILQSLLWPNTLHQETGGLIEPKVFVEAPKTSPAGEKWIASWYSREQCLGCRSDRKMANGQVLDDNAATCAFNKVKLGTKVKIVYGDKAAECIVADRIGIMGRIDLTPAVFEKMGPLSSGLLEVELFY
jgi:rare lipoprotein A (peptidoglycan hydrolase)